jgi:hypothetical protein
LAAKKDCLIQIKPGRERGDAYEQMKNLQQPVVLI